MSGARWVCYFDDVNDTCACSTNPAECYCVGEPVCSGPLVGSLIAEEVECRECGADMVALDAATGEMLTPQPPFAGGPTTSQKERER